jgi:hypothetical protein
VVLKLPRTDPQRPTILAHIRRFQHCLTNGVMVFFDVRLVTVKALEVWVVLHQDGAHPRQSATTRQVMHDSCPQQPVAT